jgi:hypothetical protein
MLDERMSSGKRSDASSTRGEKLAPAACDLCGGVRNRSERTRLIWDAGSGDELVLAELCRQCAAHPEAVLEAYGARSHGALRVTRAEAPPEREAAPAHAIRGVVLRGLLYVLLALAAFVVVTAITSHR